MKNFILSLPDELLEEVLILCIPGPDASSTVTYGAWLRLLLVCQRFSRIAKPLLYKTISIGPPSPPSFLLQWYLPSQATKSLQRSIHENPKLALHCKHLDVWFGDANLPQGDFDATIDFLKSFKKTQKLSLDGPDEPEEEAKGPIIRHQMLSAMPALTELELAYCDITELFTFDLPHLRRLRFEVHKFIAYRWSSARGLVHSTLNDRLSASKREEIRRKWGTSTITTLELVIYDDNFAGFADLLAWPRALENFDYCYPQYFSAIGKPQQEADMLQTILEPQRQSLKRLRIGLNLALTTENRADKGIAFDFSNFTALQMLRLDPWVPTQPDNLSLPPLLRGSPGTVPATNWARNGYGSWEWG